MIDLKPLMPYGASIAIVLVAIWCLKQFFGEPFKELGKRFANRVLGGRRTLGRRPLRRYRKHLVENIGKHPLGFLRDQAIDIDKLYVPLQFNQGGLRGDVYKVIRTKRTVLVLGGAGAGKSMLLKSSAFQWAQGRTRDAKIPIFVELHRFNDENESVLSLVEESLARNGLRGAKLLLTNALEAGKISLLLDGLDEVSTSRRSKAMQEIKTLAETYSDCQIVVTCRDAIYSGGLAPTFGDSVHIADFDDAAMRRFLLLSFTHNRQTDGNSRQQVDRMMADLRSNPSVLRLARSPLLLTMMASLHGADPGLGPSFIHSRAEFYREAIEHLLKRDFDMGRHEKVASYRAGHKLLVLRRIALQAQGSGGVGFDGRTVSETDILQQMVQMLAELNMEPSHARPMFDEIVSRSELLIMVDGASLQYEFPHLTLQEYLAAIELGDNPERLLALYAENPTRWRETVKLWCAAVNRDSTKVILSVFDGGNNDPVLALECLAEARQVDDLTAMQIIEHFEEHIGDSAESSPVIAALGAVAGDAGPRGRSVFSYLQSATLAADSRQRVTAMRALAASRLPSAVEFLAGLAVHQSAAREALRSMGEQAVPELINLAADGSLQAIDDIAEIGTPSAALGLCDLIWHDDATAYRAAWRLGALVSIADVEEELRRASLGTPIVGKRLEWVWAPFGEGAIRAIMGRVAFLVATSPDEILPSGTPKLDARLALPIGAINAAAEFDSTYTPHTDREIFDRASRLVDEGQKQRRRHAPHSRDLIYEPRSPRMVGLALNRIANPQKAAALCLQFLARAGVGDRTLKIWRSLPPEAAATLATGAFWDGRPKRMHESDWVRIHRKPLDEAVFFVPVTAIFMALIVLPSFIGLVHAIGNLFGLWNWGPKFLHVTSTAPYPIAAVMIYADSRKGQVADFFGKIIAVPVALILIGIASNMVVGWGTIAGWWGLHASVLVATLLILVGGVLFRIGVLVSRRVTNTFSAALRASRASVGKGASILAEDNEIRRRVSVTLAHDGRP